MTGETGLQTVEFASMKLPVWRVGAGKPLLFLDGGDGFHRSLRWRALLAESWDVHAPKYPGYGGVSFADHIRGVNELALLYLEYLEQQDLSDVLLVGASFGGWIAVEIAIRSSTRLSGMVLIDPLGVKVGKATDREISDIYAALPDEKQALLYATDAHRLFDYSGFDDSELASIVQDREAEAFYSWKPFFHNPTLDRWLFRLKLPTQFIWGAGDGFVDQTYGRKFAERVPGAKFTVIERAGHYPHVEQPDATYAEVRRFAEQL
ncbi:MAG: alpha/beta fold hydrolase [Hyphomicrobiaceae bacterium]